MVADFLYLAVQNRQPEWSDSSNHLTYQQEKETCRIQYQGEELTLDRQNMLSVLGRLVELTGDILPLGTLEGEDFYYPYGGVVYPVANFNGKEILTFTPPVIDKVIHLGYEDETEEAYVYFMKKEWILEKGKKSVGFSRGEAENGR